MRLLLSLIIMLFIPLWGWSQPEIDRCLSLQNRSESRQYLFYPGDEISVKLEGGTNKMIGNIESVSDSELVLVKRIRLSGYGSEEYQLFRYQIPIKQIAYVYYTRRPGWRTFRRSYSAASSAGGGMVIGGAVTNTIVNDATPKLNDLILASGILFSGLAIRYLGKDRYHLGNRWHLHVITPQDPAPATEPYLSR